MNEGRTQRKNTQYTQQVEFNTGNIKTHEVYRVIQYNKLLMKQHCKQCMRTSATVNAGTQTWKSTMSLHLMATLGNTGLVPHCLVQICLTLVTAKFVS